MRRTSFDNDHCPIARTSDLLDGWTAIIIRESFLGATRFDEFVAQTGAPRATLARRLDRLVADELFERVAYQANPPRYEYRLTAKGMAFFEVLAAMWRWGSDWGWPDGQQTPVELANGETGERIEPRVVDEATGDVLEPENVVIRLRPRPSRSGS